MADTLWFEDVPVIGALAPEQAAQKLREIGEDEMALQLTQQKGPSRGATTFGESGKGGFWPFQDKPWQHTEHAFGYLGLATAIEDKVIIQPVENIQPDLSLKNARVKITLDRLYVADYPGRGVHLILFDFFAQNQISHQTEDLHFNATYRVYEGDHAAVRGNPIFVGLNVGSEGLIFKCRTVNVQNEQDETFLKFLDSETFRNGLNLASTIQPAIKPLSEMAFSLTKAIMTRNRNVPVQDFSIGLDFSSNPLRPRLAEGSYLAVQVPASLKSSWEWDDWVYCKGKIVNRFDTAETIPFNYLAFSISRYEK
jgi:hypothetical protein